MQATAGGQTQKKTAEFRAHTVVPDNLIASRYQILPPVGGKDAAGGTYKGQGIELQKYPADLGGLSIELWAQGEGPTLMRADAPTPEIE